MLTLDDLIALERSAEPVTLSGAAEAPHLARMVAFERAATPYRTLLRSARLLLMAGRSIGPELEKELRDGSRALERARHRLGTVESDP